MHPLPPENVYGSRKRVQMILAELAGYAQAHHKKTDEVRVLDIGCGTGSFITLPVAHYGYDTVGIDIDEASISHAQQTSHPKNVTFLNYAPYEMPSDKFDVIICSEVLEHVDDPRLLLERIHECMHDESLLILTTPNGYGWFECEKFAYEKGGLKYPFLAVKWLLEALGIKKRPHLDGSTANTLKPHDKHVQFFTQRRLTELFTRAGFTIEKRGASTVFCGPLTNALFQCSKTFLRLNATLADKLPLALVSGWQFVLSKKNTANGAKNSVEKENLLVAFPYFPLDSFFKKHDVAKWEVIPVVAFLRRGVRGMLKALWHKKWHEFAIGLPAHKSAEGRYFLEVLSLLARARKSYLVDADLITHRVSWLRILFIRTPRMIGECILGLGLIIVSYLALLIGILFLRPRKKFKKNHTQHLLFIRTDHVGSLGVGGSFTHVEGFRDGLHEIGWSCDFIASRQPVTDLKGDHFHSAQFPESLNLVEIPALLYNFRILATGWRAYLSSTAQKKNRPAFLYHRYSAFQWSTPFLARLLGVPLFIEYNGSEAWVKEKWGKLFLRNLCYGLERMVLHSAERIAVVSDVLKEELIAKGIEAHRIILNPNGVNPHHFHPKVDGGAVRKKYGIDNKIVVGFIGSFGLWHGVEVLAQAVAPVIQKHPHVHFLIIGDGALRGTVEKILHESGAENSVTLTGSIPHDESPSYLAACDILASPHVPNADGTRFFGSPTKLFEYMAMGKAIVASNLEQIGTVLEDNKTALLVEPGSVKELVNGICTLVEDTQLRAQLGTGAHAEALKSYTWKMNAQRIISGYTHIYEE